MAIVNIHDFDNNQNKIKNNNSILISKKKPMATRCSIQYLRNKHTRKREILALIKEGRV